MRAVFIGSREPIFQEAITMTKLSIRPLGDRVIIKALPSEEKTRGGVILPDSAKEKPQQ
ncbi:MAG: hypothetical protein K6G50_04740, partial [bacterium]|nr:hypothetical protein [bacterium]